MSSTMTPGRDPVVTSGDTTDRGYMEMMQQQQFSIKEPDSDIELCLGASLAESHLLNTTVSSIAWRGVTVTVKDRETKALRNIVENVDGIVKAGEICALMGPSGCGKTTLLNVLAHRPTNAHQVSSTVLVNGTKIPLSTFRGISCFVEQEDALIGSLTVKETLDFASRLSTKSSVLPKKERLSRINNLLSAFGLRSQANTLIGTPIRKGISGGQKRRVGVASQLITSPKLLFLDEPTSGLDSAASREVVAHLRRVARANNLIVVVSIHQPSSAVFAMFDQLLLLSRGRTHYFGPVDGVAGYYVSGPLGLRVPLHTNPAEFLLEITNIDFVSSSTSSRSRSSSSEEETARERLDGMQRAWESSARCRDVRLAVEQIAANSMGRDRDKEGARVARIEYKHVRPGPMSVTLTLLHRSFIKSYRDVVAYGIRIAMYFGLAVMMGTVWLRLSTNQTSIIPITNDLFFGSAFMSFMAVAYVPAFLEDRLQYVKEHHNGLYGATELIISNFLMGVPYLFLISLLFSIISYFLSNFHPGAKPFFTYLMWLFLDLLAAESLVVFITSLFPSFVVSLALVAFANGLWMSVGGFLVTPSILNVFYRYAFHYWDYQKWVFEGMMVNEFAGRVYDCAPPPVGAGPDGACSCMFPTDLQSSCRIRGQGVLDQYGYRPGHLGRNVGILLAIAAGYRVAAWVVLMVRR